MMVNSLRLSNKNPALVIRVGKKLRILFVLSHFFAYAGVVNAAEYPVLKWIGKSEAEITTILGPGEKCKDRSQGRSCEYLDNTVQIIFIDGRADWIAIGGFQGVPFDYDALRLVGLHPTPPFVHMATRMHWQHHHGLELVSVFARGKETAFIEIRAYTAEE